MEKFKSTIRSSTGFSSQLKLIATRTASDAQKKGLAVRSAKRNKHRFDRGRFARCRFARCQSEQF